MRPVRSWSGPTSFDPSAISARSGSRRRRANSASPRGGCRSNCIPRRRSRARPSPLATSNGPRSKNACAPSHAESGYRSSRHAATSIHGSRSRRANSFACRGRGVGRVPSRDLACVFRRWRRYRGYRDPRAVCRGRGRDRSRDPRGPGVPLVRARDRRIDARGERRERRGRHGRHGRSGLRLGRIACDERHDGTATRHRSAAALTHRCGAR